MNKVSNDNESVCSNVSSTNNAEILAAVFATTSSDKWTDENSCSMSTNSNSQALSIRTNRTSTTNTNGNQDEDEESSASDVLIDENNDQSEKTSDMNSNELDEDDESVANGLSDDENQDSSNENDDNNSRVSATSSSQMVIMTDSEDFVCTKATDSTKSDKDEKLGKDEKLKKDKRKANDLNKTNKLGKQANTEFKQKRRRRTKLQMMKDAEKAAAAAQSAMDAVCASVLKKANQNTIKKPHAKLNISKKNKKFDSKLMTSNINSKRLLRSTNGTLSQNDTKNDKKSLIKTNKKSNKKSKETTGDQLNGEEKSDIEENTDDYEDDLDEDVTDKAANKMLANENKVKKNYYQLNKLKRQQHLLLTQKQHKHQLKAAQNKFLKHKKSDAKLKSSQALPSVNSKLIKRKCLVCKRKVHQDHLNEHLIEHFNESSKCVECQKVSTNPSNFVTHILSHLDNQFLCVNCDKSFKQPVLYKKHKEQCELDQQSVEPKIEPIVQQQPKQRGRPRLHKSMADSSQLSKSSSQTSIQTSKSSNLKTSTQMPIPKRLGRPPKHLKQESTQHTTKSTTTSKDQLRTNKRAKTTPSQTSEDNLDEINVSDYEQDDDENNQEEEEYEEQDEVQKTDQFKQKTQRQENKEEQSDEGKEQEAKRNMRKKLEAAIPPSLTEQQKDHLSKIATTGGGALANAIASLALKPSNNDLKTCGTYKVKLEMRKPSKLKEETQTSTTSRENSLNRSASFTLNELKTPSKSSTLINSFISTSKNSQLISSSSQSSQQTSLTSSSFECPECKRKFVSYYGLVQHYDQHPNLAVTCFICEITFDNHNLLVQHNANLHHQQENASQKDQKKGNTKTGKQANGAQQTTNQKGRNVQETVDSNGLNEITNTLPSIMTRTSRQNNNNNAHQQPSIFNQLKVTNSANQTSVLMNHSLTVKTSGFADLAFIDFSCTSFPRIAQSYCELWPRRIQSNQQQPLHKYSCDQCGFYFPCRASLKLHMLKKQFASSKLTINDKILNNLDNLDELNIRNNCELFMTNSKYMDYEKTLDEIINTLEKNEKQLPNQSSPDVQMAFSQSSRKEILKSLGLVHKNELNELNDKYTVNQTAMNASQLISLNKELNLEEFISFSQKPKLVSKNKILMLELRKQMLDINHQFEIDLNRWKYMCFHYSTGTGIQSNKTSFPVDLVLEQYANKVQMKPHVNFNRPLLIRSKRLKRNAQKHQPQFIQTVTQPTKVSTSSTTYSSSTTYASNAKTNFYEKQPVFSATSGNFSASNQLNLNKKRKLNERDQENQFVVVVSKQELKRSKQRIQQQQELHVEIERQRESELKEHLVSRKRRKGLTKRNEDEKELDSDRHSHFEHLDEDAHDALELQDEESDQNDVQLVNENIPTLKNKYKRQKAQEGQESSDKKLKQETQKTTQLTANKSSTSINSNSGQKLPAPPVLLKTVNTSANSSILARASGMSINHLVKQMPKLQPINPQPQMPKLKPISQMNHSGVNKRTQNGPIPSPPKLILAKNKQVTKSNGSGENKNEKNLTNGHHKHIHDRGEEQVEEEVLNIEARLENNENQQEDEGEENDADEEEQSEENNEMIDSLVTLKNSEHLSLKCKFCYLIFKVQSDFFQHVITNHPKMLKKCLNRAERNNTKKLKSKTTNHSSTSKNKTHNKKEINLTNETQLISEFLSTSSK